MMDYTEELRKRLEVMNTEELAFATQRELKKIGVDLDEWYRELDGNGRSGYSAEIAQKTVQDSIKRRGHRKPATAQ